MRERELRDIGSNAKTRYVSRFEHLALHPRLHHRVGFPIHYLPPREPSPRRICYNPEYRTPLSTNHLTMRQYNNQHLYRRGLQTQSPLPKRDPNSIPLRSTSTKEGYNKSKEGLQFRGLTSNTSLFLSFPQNKDPNRLG